MKEVIERCNWLVNKCNDKAITPDVKDDFRYLLEEIERLNNFIDELEKWLKEEIERLMTIEQSNNVIFLIGAYTEVLDKIEEFKGVDKE